MFKKSNFKSLIALFCLLLAIICIGTVTVFAYGSEDSEDADSGASEDAETVVPPEDDGYDNDTGMPDEVCTDHVFSSECDPECDVCGIVRPVIGVPHTFDNDCDTDCNGCGMVRVTMHYYDNELDADCNVCGDERELVMSGICGRDGDGSDLKWTLDLVTGVLEITGNGRMKHYSIVQAPWGKYKEYIKTVNIGYGVTDIGDSAFIQCSAITEVNISDSVKNIWGEAFSECYKLGSIVIPDSVECINYYAFSMCTMLESVELGNNVSYIGWGAFENCKSLKSVVIPDSVRVIDRGAFMYCEALESISIGNGIIHMEENVFFNTGYYRKNSNWENNVLYIGKYLVSTKSSSNTGYTVKEGTVLIGGSAFSNWDDLKEVTIPESVKSIGASAFFGTEYYFNKDNWENGVLYIGEFLIFVDYEFVGALEIRPGTTIIADGAASHRGNITRVTIPDSVERIGERAFVGCSELTDVVIGSNVTVINYYAFASCPKLTSVTFKTTDGWKASETYIPECIELFSESLSDPSEAALSLADDYGSYYWERAVGAGSDQPSTPGGSNTNGQGGTQSGSQDGSQNGSQGGDQSGSQNGSQGGDQSGSQSGSQNGGQNGTQNSGQSSVSGSVGKTSVGCFGGTGMYITMLFAVMIPAMFVALTKKFI